MQKDFFLSISCLLRIFTIIVAYLSFAISNVSSIGAGGLSSGVSHSHSSRHHKLRGRTYYKELNMSVATAKELLSSLSTQKYEREKLAVTYTFTGNFTDEEHVKYLKCSLKVSVE